MIKELNGLIAETQIKLDEYRSMLNDPDLLHIELEIREHIYNLEENLNNYKNDLLMYLQENTALN